LQFSCCLFVDLLFLQGCSRLSFVSRNERSDRYRRSLFKIPAGGF
jgi:hypothetical protein